MNKKGNPNTILSVVKEINKETFGILMPEDGTLHIDWTLLFLCVRV